MGTLQPCTQDVNISYMKKHKRTAYHHGSLQKALIEYAFAHVRASGWDGFSMREAARELGVSPGAAYRHFKTLDDLLFEIAHLGFEKLDEDMQKMREEAGDAHGALVGVGIAYLRFAKEEPHLFNLMFSDKIARLHEVCFEEEFSSSDCEPLVAALQTYIGADCGADIRNQCDFFWVVAHGIASLDATTGWRRSDAEKHALLEKGIASLEAGRAQSE